MANNFKDGDKVRVVKRLDSIAGAPVGTVCIWESSGRSISCYIDGVLKHGADKSLYEFIKVDTFLDEPLDDISEEDLFRKKK